MAHSSPVDREIARKSPVFNCTQGRSARLLYIAAAAGLVSLSLSGYALGQSVIPQLPPEATPQYYSDTQFSYRYQPNAKRPGRPESVSQQILGFVHANTYAYGSNFLSLDMLYSDRNDPSVNPGQGATQLYGIYRGTLSGNALLQQKPFTFGPIKDVSLAFGTDIDTKNNLFASRTIRPMLGISFAFDVPDGFVNLAVYAQKEWNNNGFVPTSVSYDPTYNIELVYSKPLPFTGLPLTANGVFALLGPKGIDGFGNRTQPEFYSQNRITLDVGALVANKPNVFDAFIGYQFWQNIYGVDARRTKGSIESSVFVGVALHTF